MVETIVQRTAMTVNWSAAPHDAHRLLEALLLLLDDGLGEGRDGQQQAHGQDDPEQELDGEVEDVLVEGGGGKRREGGLFGGSKARRVARCGGEAEGVRVDEALERQNGESHMTDQRGMWRRSNVGIAARGREGLAGGGGGGTRRRGRDVRNRGQAKRCWGERRRKRGHAG
eukprot:6202727-Pleurochrysis_carterae.AAC.2